MIAWSTVESAIHAWIVEGTGLDASQVIWANQDDQSPDGDYASITVTATPTGNGGWNIYEDNIGGGSGEELTETHYRMWELSVEVQLFGGSHRGTTSASARLTRCVGASRLTVRHESMRAAGWVPARFDPIQNASAPAGGSIFEPRAILTAYGYTSGSMSGTATYIEFVDATNEVADPDSTFTLDLINEVVT